MRPMGGNAARRRARRTRRQMLALKARCTNGLTRQILAEANRLRIQRDKLAVAVNFYATEAHYRARPGCLSTIQLDGGAAARTAKVGAARAGRQGSVV
jgi:hypothetical protein